MPLSLNRTLPIYNKISAGELKWVNKIKEIRDNLM